MNTAKYLQKNFLILLSIPITLKFFLIKNVAHSAPTRPDDPVMIIFFSFFKYINYIKFYKIQN